MKDMDLDLKKNEWKVIFLYVINTAIVRNKQLILYAFDYLCCKMKSVECIVLTYY
jgi:hypothetical protein